MSNRSEQSAFDHRLIRSVAPQEFDEFCSALDALVEVVSQDGGFEDDLDLYRFVVDRARVVSHASHGCPSCTPTAASCFPVRERPAGMPGYVYVCPNCDEAYREVVQERSHRVHVIVEDLEDDD